MNLRVMEARLERERHLLKRLERERTVDPRFLPLLLGWVTAYEARVERYWTAAAILIPLRGEAKG